MRQAFASTSLYCLYLVVITYFLSAMIYISVTGSTSGIMYIYQPLEFNWIALISILMSLIVFISIHLMIVVWVRFPFTSMGLGFSFQTMLSFFLDWATIHPLMNPQGLRSVFNGQVMTQSSLPKNHTHPDAAADRSAAMENIEAFCSLTGFEPYVIQYSRSDERKGRVGARAYFWDKDLQTSPDVFRTTDNNLLAMIDVDQYVDMERLLDNEYKPVIIYTFQPQAVSSVEKQFSFTFHEDNSVEYRVSGGGLYRHKVWNYQRDSVVVRSYIGPILRSISVYLIERKTTSPHHELILLTPVRRWRGLASWVATFIEGKTIDRYNVIDGAFTRMKIQTDTEVRISTGRPGNYSAANVLATTDECIATIAKTSKLDLTIPQVTKQLSDAKEDTSQNTVLNLYDYHLHATAGKPMFVYPVDSSVKHYTFYNHKDHEVPKPAVIPFMPPVFDGCFSPTICLENEKVAISERIEKIRPKELIVDRFLQSCITEFGEMLIPVPHQLCPEDYDKIHLRQNRPTQKRILVAGETTNPTGVVQSFLKKETYDHPNHPRVISTINPHDKLEYSALMYAFVDNILTKQEWYAFGKTPLDIANKVTELCVSAKTAIGIDFSRMDGHCNDLDRNITLALFLRAYHPRYHGQIIETLRSQINQRGFGALGTAYATLLSRLSGSPETAGFNTLITGLIIYISYRMTNNPSTARFHTAKEAWAKLQRCLAGGDDSLLFDITSEVAVKAAARLGQVAEAEVFQRGTIGVNFLSRFYTSEVWHGNNNSTCDIPRQARKFHVTTKLPNNVTTRDKLIEKASAFCLTDNETPIIGQLCSTVMYLVKREDSANDGIKFKDYVEGVRNTHNNLNIWQPYKSFGVQYPNRITLDQCTEILQFFKIDHNQYATFSSWLEGIVDVNDVLTSCPIAFTKDDPLKLRASVVINDELHVVVPNEKDPMDPADAQETIPAINDTPVLNNKSTLPIAPPPNQRPPKTETKGTTPNKAPAKKVNGPGKGRGRGKPPQNPRGRQPAKQVHDTKSPLARQQTPPRGRGSSRGRA